MYGKPDGETGKVGLKQLKSKKEIEENKKRARALIFGDNSSSDSSDPSSDVDDTK